MRSVAATPMSRYQDSAKGCRRCPQIFTGRTKSVLCSDCRYVLNLEERKAWANT